MHQLTKLPKLDGTFRTITKYALAEFAARQLVLTSISALRANRRDWKLWGDNVNAFEVLVVEGLAIKDIDGNFIASEILQARHAEVCAARITFDAAAEKLGKVLPTKAIKATPIKHAGPKTKGSIDTLKEFIEEGDIENADQYANNIGQPLVFGTGPKNKPANVYIQGEPLEIEGQPFFVAKRHSQNKSFWYVISKNTGQSLVGVNEILTTKAAALTAVKEALEKIEKHGRTLEWCCNNAPQISQAELRSTYINHPEGVTP